MSCMSTVGFGNISSTTDNERVSSHSVSEPEIGSERLNLCRSQLFSVCMMIISALLYAAIFGHMTTIIQQMTSATVRYGTGFDWI